MTAKGIIARLIDNKQITGEEAILLIDSMNTSDISVKRSPSVVEYNYPHNPSNQSHWIKAPEVTCGSVKV